ncbi:MAG: bis(5'-nucleosyl)-tetraphosphatase (symmetrical) YqeK [Butyrivibrio sp.]|jgi:predicted HD superfamily hydrolase involved in NAD metabolism|uniref:bis(5'-nucleosyl)-tetraphosphatase (symmetrical) n=1 Tax=Butyrivibrio hungatei TaxID=185008 RepID=A0A1G5AWT4_9FIRM|nr:bis(5'-nucleosyl)-tetraphosphatase (symmetrical) YqeK [Butyrivibrio hungatei]MBQ4219913.1 bis(5'-nucleosyl)-tetraphosphatase (symmetrical) YqeK [Butyrivibrio sp.]MBR4358538.1 bis(5'-nucleosyl)-tetraphosphatase (symmetrical) YqeK [Butyrivibrio sp.]MCR4997688.1 bis(5'-nucleosyl)-tetraphosphatase (symmetrical) YqeK [Butyrivibrio sp.]MEE3470736.1 bis(5'-nucleosyl)-tetraphosphatase (symmetrical) YqeK [Butyrivibrio hungatei]SCX82311.1 putative HD superfamily hydrolase of NAD metabolism [Butyrivib
MKTLEITQKLRKELEKELKPDRYDHTLGVAYTSASLAMVHGANVDKALIAGFLHDCAKCLSHEEQLNICEKNNIEITDVERRNHSLLHAKAGMYIASTKYEVRDPEILNAIRYHTTGKEDMSLLEKIVYIADFIEPNRKPLDDMNIIRKEAFTDIDRCLAHILHNSIVYLRTIGKECDDTTMKAYEFYKKYYN